MKNLIVAAAACVSVLLTGYDCAFADPLGEKTQTLPLQIITRTTGYPMPGVPAELRDAENSFTEQNPYSALIAKYAKENGVPVVLATAVVQIESNFNPKRRGSAGEIGLMQIKPTTAKLMGYSGKCQGTLRSRDEHQVRYEVPRHGARTWRRTDVQHHPQIQCRPCGDTHESDLAAILRQGAGAP